MSGIDVMDLKPDTWFPTAEIVELAGLSDRPQPPVQPFVAGA